MKTVVQFGAGSIGRGFTGQLFWEGGYETVFVDVVPELVEALNRIRAYPLRLVGPERRETLIIRPVRAVDGRDVEAVAEAIASADLACTAVGAQALPHLGPTLAAGLRERSLRPGSPPLDVLLCENQIRCSELLRLSLEQALGPGHSGLLARTGLVETVVGRMVPLVPEEERAREPLLAIAEDYARLPADRRAFAGPIPEIHGLEPVEDLAPIAERKLYCHNLGHAVAAYLGYHRGCATIAGALAEPEVSAEVEGAMGEAGEALCRKHGFDRQEMRAYAADLLRRFRNPDLRDTLLRVGREPLRKLGPGERLTGALSLCLDQGVEPRSIPLGIAAALGFDAPSDPAAVDLRERLSSAGLDGVLAQVCGLPPDGGAASLIRAALDRLDAWEAGLGAPPS